MSARKHDKGKPEIFFFFIHVIINLYTKYRVGCGDVILGVVTGNCGNGLIMLMCLPSTA